MTIEFPSPAQYENSADAEVALAELEMNASLVQAWEAADRFRDEYAQMFREIIGVPLGHRAAYRAALEQIRARGHETVQQARERCAQSNGTGSAA